MKEVRVLKRMLVFNLFPSALHYPFTNININDIISTMLRITTSNLFDSAVILFTAAQTKLSGRAGAIVKSSITNEINQKLNP